MYIQIIIMLAHCIINEPMKHTNKMIFVGVFSYEFKFE